MTRSDSGRSSSGASRGSVRTTEGTMEVVEFAPEKVMRVETHDGPMIIHGWARFEVIGRDETRLTIGGDIPGVDESVAAQIRTMISRRQHGEHQIARRVRDVT